jgi:hypothetical protein
MEQRHRRKQASRAPEVRVRYEPHRLADACIEQAYAWVAPVIRGVTRPAVGPGRAPAQQAGGERQ